MTATDELRRMLDERGVEWHDSSDENVRHTTWDYTHCWFNEFADGWTAWGEVRAGTPEQAIEATLGRGTCRFIDEDNYNETEGCDPYSWFRCSACGWTFDECDRWLTTMSYCPNCGRRVVAGDAE